MKFAMLFSSNVLLIDLFKYTPRFVNKFSGRSLLLPLEELTALPQAQTL